MKKIFASIVIVVLTILFLITGYIIFEAVNMKLWYDALYVLIVNIVVLALLIAFYLGAFKNK